MTLLFLVCAVVLLGYANGANDNFKGVATLFGSRTAGYRKALGWATAATFAGSLAALWVSQGLIRAFSGKGLVPPEVAAQPVFLLAVGLGAAATVYLATVTGFPISTTHALTGALVGAGAAAAGSELRFAALGKSFLLPLGVSPFLAFAATAFLYPLFRFCRQRLGVTKRLCLCEGPARQPVAVRSDGTLVLVSTGTALSVGEQERCVEEYRGVILGIDCQWWLDRLHYLSAGAVSFARGLNDAPKIAALLIAAHALGMEARWGLLGVGSAMAFGGLLQARRVAHTMSERITRMNHGQGFTANLVTSLLVTVASRFGVPVSTTHVSCGSLFGLGAVTGQGRWPVIRNVILSWVVTLPVACLLAAALYLLL